MIIKTEARMHKKRINICVKNYVYLAKKGFFHGFVRGCMCKLTRVDMIASKCV